ncbi:MAG: efflux RND transporter periplasmic adaptor subunit [Nitrospirota bacterium]
MKKIESISIITILIFISLLVLPVSVHSQKPSKMPPTPVEVASVKPVSVKVSIPLIGIVEPLVSASVVAEVSGVITRCYKDEGDFVKRGEIICQLDRVKREVAVNLASARLKQAEAELEKLKKGLRKEEIRKKKAIMANRKAIANRLKTNYQRMEELSLKGIVSEEEKQNSKWEYEQADALLMEARADLDLAEHGTREEDIIIAEHEVKAKRESLRELKDSLSKTSVRSMITGFIVSKHKEIGEWVDIGEEIVNIISTEKVIVSVSIHESEINSINSGEKAAVRIGTYPDAEFSGTIRHIIPEADPKSHAFPVKIEIDNKEHKIKPGMSANVSLFTAKERRVLGVPRDALVKRGESFFVFAVRDSIAVEIEVEKGESLGSMIEVRGDIRAGDKVVVTGNEGLRNGTSVNVVNLNR